MEFWVISSTWYQWMVTAAWFGLQTFLQTLLPFFKIPLRFFVKLSSLPNTLLFRESSRFFWPWRFLQGGGGVRWKRQGRGGGSCSAYPHGWLWNWVTVAAHSGQQSLHTFVQLDRIFGSEPSARIVVSCIPVSTIRWKRGGGGFLETVADSERFSQN